MVAEWSPAPLRNQNSARLAPHTVGGVNLSSGIASKPLPRTQAAIGTGRFIGDTRGNGPRAKVNDDDGVTLNLVNAPIAQAAKMVLGDILLANYVVDPKVEGKVTIHTSVPTSRADVTSLFENALRASNAALIETGGGYKIVPLDQAISSGAPLRSRNAADGQIGEGVEVIQLRYVSAANMKRVLEPMAPKGGLLSIDESRGLLTLGGAPHERAMIKDAVAMFDVDTMRGMSFAIVPVRSADPDSLADDLRNVFGSEKEGPMGGMIRFIGNKRLSSVLVITSQPKYLTRADAWIRKLDGRAQGREKQFYTYKVQNRSAKELVSVLTSIFSSETGGGSARNNNVAPRAQQASLSAGALAASNAAASLASPNGQPFGGLSNSMNAGNSGQGRPSSNNSMAGSPGFDAGGGAQATLGDDARFKIAADESKNSLIIMATADDYKRIMRVIETLDLLPNQVLIEATIAEVTLNDDMKFGVRWYMQDRHSKGTFTNDIAGGLGSVFPGFSYMLKGMNAQLTLNALSAVTNVNVISSPSLTVLDNKTATLQVGDQVPVATQSAVSVAAIGAPIVNSVTYKDTGVILSITPHINESGRVLLDIEQEVSSVSPTTTSNIDSPTIQQRKVKTSVILNDSEALALGGLQQNKRTTTRDGVPLLSDVPFLGAAFRSKADEAKKTELVILITPKVIRSLSEAQEVTDEFRKKLFHIMPRTRLGPRTFEQTARRMIE